MEQVMQIKTERKLYEILDDLVYSSSAKFTVGELAEVLKLSAATVYAKVKGDRPITLYEFIALAKAYAKRGEFALVNLVVPDGYSLAPVKDVTVDGSLDDEAADILEAVGGVITKFEHGDRKGAMKLIPGVKSVVSRMEKEVAAK